METVPVEIARNDGKHFIIESEFLQQGFKLNIGVSILGPMIIFPRTVIGWNITTVGDIHEDSMTLFRVLDPKPDILLLGLDKAYPRETKFITDFKEIAHGLDIRYEVLSVDKACTTFNFLNAERRYAVAALLPPNNLDDCDGDSLTDLALRRVLHQNWESPNDPRLENPNTMEQIYFPTEETERIVEEARKGKAERDAKKNGKIPE